MTSNCVLNDNVCIHLKKMIYKLGWMVFEDRVFVSFYGWSMSS